MPRCSSALPGSVSSKQVLGAAADAADLLAGQQALHFRGIGQRRSGAAG
jgi:hypothetical protein